MDRAAALARLNRRMLEAFSARTVGALRASLPLRLALPRLEQILKQNLDKEIRKDALVIRRAGEALAAGAPPGAHAARQLLDSARQIDREFVARLGRFALRLEIPYARIEPLRLRRIGHGLDLAYRILDAWRRRRRLRDAFSSEDLERRLLEILTLYCEETIALGDTARLPGPLAPVGDRLAARLLEAMTAASRGLARDIARSVTAAQNRP
ncbi:MAG: hypothetical protein A2W21_13070 [Betaproteobacteria bacterium RBG_16_66_20]|nr:MAG: hypothetical protein A2W21_13070 [Betaproteobacteria bacterium RBG_16_66_20]